MGARWVGAVCPGFFDGAVEIWRASPAKFQGVELVIPQGTHLVHDMTKRCAEGRTASVPLCGVRGKQHPTSASARCLLARRSILGDATVFRDT